MRETWRGRLDFAHRKVDERESTSQQYSKARKKEEGRRKTTKSKDRGKTKQNEEKQHNITPRALSSWTAGVGDTHDT